jgi:hypothetical protein
MISNTEALLISIMGIYTIIIVWGIHHYEAKLKRALHWLSELEEDHFQTFNAYCNMSELARQYRSYSNAEHYTQLQLENQTLKAQIDQYKSGISALHSGIHTGFPSVSDMSGMSSGHYSNFEYSKDREDEMNRINAEKYERERKLWESNPRENAERIAYQRKVDEIRNNGGMGVVSMDVIPANNE